MQQQTLAGASTTRGYALRVGEERKMVAHSGACQAAGVTFIPLVVESLGGWREEAIQTIKSIGRLQGQHLGIPPPETTRHLFQRLYRNLPLERECLTVGQAATSLLSHSRWHCLTCFFLLFLFVYCIFIVFFCTINLKIYLSIYRDSAAIESTRGSLLTLVPIKGIVSGYKG